MKIMMKQYHQLMYLQSCWNYKLEFKYVIIGIYNKGTCVKYCNSKVKHHEWIFRKKNFNRK